MVAMRAASSEFPSTISFSGVVSLVVNQRATHTRHGESGEREEHQREYLRTTQPPTEQQRLGQPDAQRVEHRQIEYRGDLIEARLAQDVLISVIEPDRLGHEHDERRQREHRRLRRDLEVAWDQGDHREQRRVRAGHIREDQSTAEHRVAARTVRDLRDALNLRGVPSRPRGRPAGGGVLGRELNAFNPGPARLDPGPLEPSRAAENGWLTSYYHCRRILRPSGTHWTLSVVVESFATVFSPRVSRDLQKMWRHAGRFWPVFVLPRYSRVPVRRPRPKHG